MMNHKFLNMYGIVQRTCNSVAVDGEQRELNEGEYLFHVLFIITEL